MSATYEPMRPLHAARDDLLAAQDDFLVDLVDKRVLNQAALRKLPPWRAVFLARIAVKLGLMSPIQLEIMRRSASHVGGNGVLGVEVWTDLPSVSYGPEPDVPDA